MDEKEQNLATETMASEKIDLEKLIEDMKAQGLGYDEMVAALAKMVEEGKLTEEEFEKGKMLLGEVDKKEASDLFGVDIL